MTAHTPAPWDDSTGPLLGADGTPVGEQQYNVTLLDQLERIRADRALMRAAPELLAALRALLAKHDDRDALSDLWPVQAAQARDAIAKAEGR